jgi:hypothetical protein
MITFNQYITELFDKAAPYQIVNEKLTHFGGYVRYHFEIDSLQYDAYVTYSSKDKSISVDFKLKRSDGTSTVETTGEAGHDASLKVFGTLAEILRHALGKWPKARILFNGDGDSRVKLYRSLGMKIAKILGYNYEADGGGNHISITLTPK